MLSFVIFLPIAGALAMVLLPKKHEGLAKWLAAGVSVVVLAVVIGLFIAYDRDDSGYQFVNETTLSSRTLPT